MKSQSLRFLSSEPIDKMRQHLPHWKQRGTCVFVTFRLADSLPQTILGAWEEERRLWMATHPRPWTADEEAEYGREFGRKLDEWLDKGYGSCLLADAANRTIVWDALSHFDGIRYTLYSFVVMGNHVHALVQPMGNATIQAILRSWKTYTARRINQRTGRRGGLWRDEAWDRLVRNDVHFARIVRYIVRNPVKAGRAEVPVYVRKGLEWAWE